jgi:hypothetical protein
MAKIGVGVDEQLSLPQDFFKKMAAFGAPSADKCSPESQLERRTSASREVVS